MQIDFQQNIVKIKGQNFTGMNPSQVPVSVGAKKCITLPYLLIKLKDLFFFSSVLVILTVVQNEVLATDSQNAILNYFENYKSLSI